MEDNVKLLDNYIENCTYLMNQLNIGDFFFILKENVISAGVFMGITEQDISNTVDAVCNANNDYVEDLNLDNIMNKSDIYLFYSYLELFSLRMRDNIHYQMQMAVDLLKRMISEDEIHIKMHNVRRTSNIMVQKIDDTVCNIDITVRLLKDKMLNKNIYSDYYTVQDAEQRIRINLDKRLIKNPKKDEDIVYLAYKDRKPVTVKTKGLVFREEIVDGYTSVFRPYFILHSSLNKNKVSLYSLVNVSVYSNDLAFETETISRKKMLCLRSVIKDARINLEHYMLINKPVKIKFPTNYFDRFFYLENMDEIVEELEK